MLLERVPILEWAGAGAEQDMASSLLVVVSVLRGGESTTTQALECHIVGVHLEQVSGADAEAKKLGEGCESEWSANRRRLPSQAMRVSLVSRLSAGCRSRDVSSERSSTVFCAKSLSHHVEAPVSGLHRPLHE